MNRAVDTTSDVWRVWDMRKLGTVPDGASMAGPWDKRDRRRLARTGGVTRKTARRVVAALVFLPKSEGT